CRWNRFVDVNSQDNNATARRRSSQRDVSFWHTSSLPTSEVDTSVDDGGGDQRLRVDKPINLVRDPFTGLRSVDVAALQCQAVDLAATSTAVEGAPPAPARARTACPSRGTSSSLSRCAPAPARACPYAD